MKEAEKIKHLTAALKDVYMLCKTSIDAEGKIEVIEGVVNSALYKVRNKDD